VLILMPLIASCSNSQRVVRPSSYLTVDCKQPVIDGKKWRDIATHAVRLEESVAECTGRMKEIRGD